MTRNFGVQHRPRVDPGFWRGAGFAALILTCAIIAIIAAIGVFHG